MILGLSGTGAELWYHRNQLCYLPTRRAVLRWPWEKALRVPAPYDATHLYCVRDVMPGTDIGCAAT
eukprot:641591-Rhodomonas_salina.1